MSDLTAVESYFEAVSGLTTSGSTVLNTTEIWPRALLMYRSQLQWLGGYFMLLTIVLIMAPLGIGGLQQRRGGFGSGGDVMTGAGSPVRIAGQIALLYGVLTFACFALLFVSGHQPIHAAAFAFAALSTGSFLPFDGQPVDVLNTFGISVVGGFLVLGATSIFWQRRLLRGQFRLVRDHRESRSIIAGTVALTVVFAALLVATPGYSPDLTTMARSLFNAASLVATSGMQSEAGVFVLLPYSAVLFVVLIGGSAYATAGGVKHYRISAMLAQSRAELDKLVFPNAVKPSSYGVENAGMPVMRAIWSFFIAALAVILSCAFVLTWTGMHFEAAFMAAVANFATAGPVYLAGWNPDGLLDWPRYSEMTSGAQLTLAFTMIAGRIEVLALLALVSPRYWRSR